MSSPWNKFMFSLAKEAFHDIVWSRQKRRFMVADEDCLVERAMAFFLQKCKKS